MDKLLLSTFFALLAGFIAAAMSYVKLVNDKESRITDYREEWTSSVRKSLADLVAHINSICSLTDSIWKSTEAINQTTTEIERDDYSDRQRDILQKQLDHHVSNLEDTKKKITSTRMEMNQTYNLARLHFKQNDPAFGIIENKVDNIKTLLNEMNAVKVTREKVTECRGRIDVFCNDIIVASRGIMKDEWERIKKGELNFQRTQNVAKWGGVLLLFVLFTIGIHASIATYQARGGLSLMLPEVDDYKKDKVNQATSPNIEKTINQSANTSKLTK